MRKPRCCSAVHGQSLDAFDELEFDSVAQTLQSPGLFRAFLNENFHGLGHAYNGRYVEGARPTPFLLSAPRNQRVYIHPSPHVQDAHALRSVHLMARKRHHIYSYIARS